MTYCITIPELSLSALQQKNLLDFYNLNEEKFGNKYSSDSGNLTELIIVGGYEKSSTIKIIENKINTNYIDASYFVSNFGISPHIDDNRQCIISFEIQNIENIPINFNVDDKINQIYYNREVLMWTPQVKHSANNSKSKRIFFQIELKRNLIYDQYLDLYNRNILIK